MHATETKQVNLPHEEGEWIEIRRLSAKKLKKARQVRRDAVIADAQVMGPEFLKTLPKMCRRGCGEEKHAGECPPPEERIDPNAADPTDEYDTDTLLYAGIVAWSSELKVTPANIDELDEPTVAWLKAELVAYNRAPSKEEQGN